MRRLVIGFVLMASLLLPATSLAAPQSGGFVQPFGLCLYTK